MQVPNPPPRVSVIIPHLNEPEALSRCIGSLQKQKVDGVPFEIIVVDNGSRHSPDGICAGVRLEREHIPGPGPARNRGAQVAKGEFLAFIDADCVADEGWVRGIVTFFDSNPDVSCLAGDIRVACANPEHATSVEAFENVFSYRARLYVERHHYAATGNMAVRREAFTAVGPFGGIAVMEDRDWGQRATALGFRIAYVPEMRVLTSPCGSFAELAKRWDRHVAHEFERVGGNPLRMAVWFFRSLAFAASPVREISTVLQSDRVSGLRERLLAFTCLTRVRLYRARRMLELGLRRDTTRMIGNWNRD